MLEFLKQKAMRWRERERERESLPVKGLLWKEWWSTECTIGFFECRCSASSAPHTKLGIARRSSNSDRARIDITSLLLQCHNASSLLYYHAPQVQQRISAHSSTLCFQN
jgi:hypothetical protein